jgi:hypothetical protein
MLLVMVQAGREMKKGQCRNQKRPQLDDDNSKQNPRVSHIVSFPNPLTFPTLGL